MEGTCRDIEYLKSINYDGREDKNISSRERQLKRYQLKLTREINDHRYR